MPAVPPTKSRLVVTREGRAITSTVPKPVVIIDSREQTPFSFAQFSNWIASTEVKALPTADYSVQGMQDLIALERKSLADAVGSVLQNRERFLRECERLANYKHKAILIEASFTDMKTPYRFTQDVRAHPNGVVGTLDAIEARYGIPIIYTSTDRALAEERAASWLSKHFTYTWLEQHGLGRVLQEGDL